MSLADAFAEAARAFGALKQENQKAPKGSDECYTPPEVYQVVLDYCVKRYGIDPADVVRPFKPGGDYESEDYEGKVVVDNPPFSILAAVKAFYLSHGVRFFLFAPTLTLLSSPAYVKSLCHISCAASVIYANGADVQTSFVTNMEPGICIRTDPALKDAIEGVQQPAAPKLAKYDYPPDVVTAAKLHKLNSSGIDFFVRQDECLPIPALDEQRSAGKSIFGGGLLLNKAALERHEAALERHEAALERHENTVHVWHLSEREKAMQRYMSTEERA